MNESQMELLAERGQDFVWRVEQRNKKTYLKFDVGENRENVKCSWAEYVEIRPTLYANFCCIKVGSETNTTTDTSE